MEHKEEKNNQSEQQEEKRKEKNKNSTNSIWDNFRCLNICLTWVQEGEKEKQETENLFAKINERKVPRFGEGNTHTSPGCTESPKQDAPKRTTPRQIIIKMPRFEGKDRILKAARKKQRVTYKRVPIRLSADFWKEILQARRDCQELFKVMKSKDLQPRLLYQQSDHLEWKDR